MPLSAKTIRKQLALCKPLLCALSLKTIRRGQNAVGQLMESRHRNSVIVKEHGFEKFPAAWVLPRDERRVGVILYLHGGGYAYGGRVYDRRCILPAYRSRWCKFRCWRCGIIPTLEDKEERRSSGRNGSRRNDHW